MATSRVRRGRTTQVLVAQLLQKNGLPDAGSRAASLPGEDIIDAGELSIEVKTGGSSVILPGLRQAKKNAGPEKFPLVFWRPNGYGEERIGKWVVSMTLDDALTLLKRADFL